MKVPKSYIGKEVRLTWCDPTYNRREMGDLLKGRDALSTWTERGVIFDITDGIVCVAHSTAKNAGSPKDVEMDELSYTAVHEALIETLVVLLPQQEIQDAPAL